MLLSEKAKETKANYMRKYRQDNKERIAKQNAEWGKNNPKAIKRHQRDYWERQATIERSKPND